MENLTSPKSFIRPKEIIILITGFILLLISLKLDKYLNSYVVVSIMLGCLAFIEFTVLRIVYFSFFSKEKRIDKTLTKKAKLILTAFCLIALIWSIMFFMIFSNVIGIIFHG